MRPNLICIISLCFISLILSCGDDEDEPSIEIVKAPTDNVTFPDADDLTTIADPLEEHVQEPVVVEPDADPIQEAIDGVLENMREGYEKEDLDLYLSAFWIDGFQYISDMTTPHDLFDDVIFDILILEAQSAASVFANF